MTVPDATAEMLQGMMSRLSEIGQESLQQVKQNSAALFRQIGLHDDQATQDLITAHVAESGENATPPDDQPPNPEAEPLKSKKRPAKKRRA